MLTAVSGVPRGVVRENPQMGDGVTSVADEVDAVLLDIDGVLVVSWEAIPGVKAAFQQVMSSAIPVRLVTNTTSASRSTIAHRLTMAGMPVEPDRVITAPLATAAWIRSERPDARCYLINSGVLGRDLDGIDWVREDDPADVVVLGGAGNEFTYEQMNHALGLLLEGAELVAMHRNRYWRTKQGYQLDTGAYLDALQSASGVEPVVLGKPSPDFFTTALADLDVAPERAAMVGDDIDNDVLAAQHVGMVGVLARTGKYREEAVASAAGEPDHVIDSFADLPRLLGLDTPV